MTLVGSCSVLGPKLGSSVNGFALAEHGVPAGSTIAVTLLTLQRNGCLVPASHLGSNRSLATPHVTGVSLPIDGGYTIQ